MQYVILSAVKGYSTKTYPTHELALEAARAAWKRDPEGVGMCTIAEYHVSTECDPIDCFCEFEGATNA